MSPSSRGRGLKSSYAVGKKDTPTVALFTRAWIEISIAPPVLIGKIVALFTRAWIEIFFVCEIVDLTLVALFTRAWIEIYL